jgi:superfamily II DNA or RNA helicase
MLQAATGFGKTLVAAKIIESALAKGNRIVFTVPAITLIDQTVEAFAREGIHDIGVMQAQHPLTNPNRRVQIASVQTLERRTIPDFDLALVDEAHRDFKLFHRWFEERPGMPFIGLSATPWTRGLGRLYDTLIISATTKDLIAKGFLKPFRVFAPSHPDLKGVRTVAGDYHEGDLSKVMSGKDLVADVVTTWLAKASDRPTLVFAVDRAHARELQQQFQAAGINAGYIDALTEPAERQSIARAFRDRTMPVVCNVGVLTTGVDWRVGCIALARPTKSEILYTQIIGRGLRKDGEEDLIILDHSDTTLRLGFVTDIHHDKLSTGKLGDAYEATPKEALPKDCPQCAFVIPARTYTCPSCGWTAKKKTQSDVVHHAGELVELDEHRKAKTAEKRNKDEDWSAKIIFMGQLRAYAKERNLSEGWVAHKYRAFYSVWPNDPHVKYAPIAAGVSMEVRSWIKAQGIRWAKAQQKIRAERGMG